MSVAFFARGAPLYPPTCKLNSLISCADGYNSVKHGLDFAQDLKLMQYMKIAPRIGFAAQIYASVLSCLVQVGVLTWMQGTCAA